MRRTSLRPSTLYWTASHAPRHFVPALLLAISPLWRRDGHPQAADAVFTPQPDVSRPMKLDGPQIGYLVIKPLPLVYGPAEQTQTLETFGRLHKHLGGAEVATYDTLDALRPLLLPWMLPAVEDSRDIAEPWTGRTDW